MSFADRYSVFSQEWSLFEKDFELHLESGQVIFFDSFGNSKDYRGRVKSLPESLGRISSLNLVYLCGCDELESIPEWWGKHSGRPLSAGSSTTSCTSPALAKISLAKTERRDQKSSIGYLSTSNRHFNAC
jgi:hypothetical protein